MKENSWNSVHLVLLLMFGSMSETNGLTSLEDIAPPDYDYLRPPNNGSAPVDVEINIKKMSIRSIDESDMSISVAIELWQNWYDHRLIYPSWGKGESTVLDSSWTDKLWSPKLFFVNGVDGKLDNIITPSSFFWITKENRMFYCCRVIVKLICLMDLKDFPHDQQSCSILMASAIYSSLDVRLRWRKVERETQMFSLQQFDIVDMNQSSSTESLGTKSNVSCLGLTIFLHRRIGYYIINTYMPTILIVIMSMLTFWIPYDAVPARITLGVTSLLTIITKQYQASMPNVSYIVALNVWLSSCIAFVFFSLVEFAVVITLSSRSKKKASMSEEPPDLVLPMVMLRSNGTWSMKDNWSNGKANNEAVGAKRLDYFSRLFFPIAFVIFCIVYIKCYY